MIDRLSADLREAFPEMQGLSPRNLKYMRAFALAWPDRDLLGIILSPRPIHPLGPFCHPAQAARPEPALHRTVRPVATVAFCDAAYQMS